MFRIIIQFFDRDRTIISSRKAKAMDTDDFYKLLFYTQNEAPHDMSTILPIRRKTQNNPKKEQKTEKQKTNCVS